MKTLIVVAMRREANAIGGSTFAAGTGPGGRAVLAARLALDPPERVIIAGLCGGLDPSLRPGGVILAREALQEGSEPLKPDNSLFATVRQGLRSREIPFVSSSLLTVETPLTNARTRVDLWNAWGAAGVDMETYGFAETVTGAGLPWIALRVVVDAAGGSLPEGLAAWRGEPGETRIVRQALLRPADWPRYARLAYGLPGAQRALRRAVRAAAATLRAGDSVESVPVV